LLNTKKKENIKERSIDKKLLSKQYKKLEWGIEKGRFTEGPKTVILKNVFKQEDLSSDPIFVKNLKDEIKDECEKIGPVQKVRVFQNNPDGVVEIRFIHTTSADKCVVKMNGRFFDKKKISAEIWDKVTKYNLNEDFNEDDDLKKWENFGKYIEEDEGGHKLNIENDKNDKNDKE